MVEIVLCTTIAAPVERCFDLSRSIELHLLGTEQTGEQAVGGVTSGLIGAGEFVRWRATHFGVRQHPASRITAYERPNYVQDSMIEGAFRSMKHDRFFRELEGGRTEMRDVFLFAAPSGVVGWMVERMVLRRYLRRFLERRHAILREAAESEAWRQILPG